MCLWHIFLTEHEVTNKITFSAVRAVHGLTLSGGLSTEPTGVLAASEDFTRANSHLEILSVTSMQCSL